MPFVTPSGEPAWAQRWHIRREWKARPPSFPCSSELAKADLNPAGDERDMAILGAVRLLHDLRNPNGLVAPIEFEPDDPRIEINAGMNDLTIWVNKSKGNSQFCLRAVWQR